MLEAGSPTTPPPPVLPAGARRLAAAAAGAVVLHLALIQPNHPDAATWGAFRLFPLELPAILIALVLARGAVAAALRAGIAAALVAMAALKLADLAGHLALGRGVNPTLDLHLATSGWRFASGALGTPLAAGLLLAGGASLAAGAALIWWATGRVAALDPPRRVRPALALLLAPALLAPLADAAREASPVDPPGAAFTTRLAWEHLSAARSARADLADFRVAAAEDPAAALAAEAILPALQGRDVFLIFVESYGRFAFEDRGDGPDVAATLAAVEADLAASGLAARSGWLASPVVGGQSWLAHATALSGLRIDSEGRHRALLASPRRTLLHLAQEAGWRTVGVMPAITFAWPEAAWFGYDRTLAAADLGYDGPAFDWVTTPDQFTLAALERAELAGPERPPVFAEIALVSSHAPFTPVPPLLPWEALGDGRVFAPYAEAGPAAEEIWNDPEQLRAAWRGALDYSLRAVGGFAARRAGEGALLVVLGDHQPSPVVSGGDFGPDVPVHVIGPPELMARVAAWGWTPGLAPDPAAASLGMEAFRDRFLAAFAAPAGRGCAAAGARPLPPPDGC
jgi:hypothetical protein